MQSCISFCLLVLKAKKASKKEWRGWCSLQKWHEKAFVLEVRPPRSAADTIWGKNQFYSCQFSGKRQSICCFYFSVPFYPCHFHGVGLLGAHFFGGWWNSGCYFQTDLWNQTVQLLLLLLTNNTITRINQTLYGIYQQYCCSAVIVLHTEFQGTGIPSGEINRKHPPKEAYSYFPQKKFWPRIKFRE